MAGNRKPHLLACRWQRADGSALDRSRRFGQFGDVNSLLARYPVCLLGAALLPLVATAEQAAKPYELSLTPAFVSQYMYRGTLLGHAAMQPSAAVSWGDNSVELWSSIPVGAKASEGEVEVDLIGTRTWSLSEKTTLETMVQIYTYPRADLNDGYYRFTVEPSLGVIREIGGVEVAPRIYYDFYAKGPTAELTLTRTFNLTERVSLETAAAVGAFRYRDAVNRSETPVVNAGRYWSVGATLSVPTGANATFSFGWTLAAGEKNYYEVDGERTANDAAVRRGVLSLSWSWTL